jgi:hypothetical protein
MNLQLYTALVTELAQIFPDRRFHMGVDEVNFDCLNITRVNTWMASHGIQAGDYKVKITSDVFVAKPPANGMRCRLLCDTI